MNTNSKAVERVAAWLNSGKLLDQILSELRTEGYSMGDCALLLSETKGIELDEASQLVVTSQAWADQRPICEETERAFWDSATKLGETQLDGSTRINLSDL